jgi:3-oxoacyl-(acyl-carrier-protein) synthase
MMREMHVCAASLWSPGYPDLAAWLERRAVQSSGPPSAELLPRRARGRASLLTSMLAEVVARAAADGHVNVAEVPLIVGSAYGEVVTTSQLLAMMSEGDGALSPARFQASVHNAGAGQISIASGNRGFSNCLAAGVATSAAVLVEAYAWLSSGGSQVIAAVADETLPPFFDAEPGYAPLAAALLLSSEPKSRVLATLGAPLHYQNMVQPSDAASDGEFGRNPVSPFLTVLSAALRSPSGVVELPGVSGVWRIAVTPREDVS